MHSNHEYFWRAYELNEYIPKICMHSLLRPLVSTAYEGKSTATKSRNRVGSDKRMRWKRVPPVYIERGCAAGFSSAGWQQLARPRSTPPHNSAHYEKHTEVPNKSSCTFLIRKFGLPPTDRPKNSDGRITSAASLPLLPIPTPPGPLNAF